jgi:hypothetical protein
VIDEETQKNDLDIVREVLKVTKKMSIERAYDFSFAKKSDSELTQARSSIFPNGRKVACPL